MSDTQHLENVEDLYQTPLFVKNMLPESGRALKGLMRSLSPCTQNLSPSSQS